MAFVVRNSFSFGPNSIQVGVPDSKEVVQDNSIVIGKPMKNSKLIFSPLFFLACASGLKSDNNEEPLKRLKSTFIDFFLMERPVLKGPVK